MSDVIGRGVIEMSADSTKLKAGIADAKKSIKDLGSTVSGSMQEATGKASKSIDNYIKRLQTSAATNGKSARETELYTLALRGASKAQLAAADSALKMNEGYQKGIAIGEKLRYGFIAIAAAASAAAVASVSHSIALLDSLDDLAEKSGISVDALSKLRFAGESTGTSFDELKGGLTKLAKQMAEAAGGNKEAIATFDALGVAVVDSAGKLRSSDDVLTDLARSFSGYEDGAAKAALAQRVFGKSGEAMIPLLNQGADGLERLRKEATSLGAIYSGELAKSAADFNDNLTKIKLASEASAISISGPLIGALARLSAEFLEAKKNGGLFHAGLQVYMQGVKDFYAGDLFSGPKAKTTAEIQAFAYSRAGLPAGGGRGFNNPKVAAPVVQEPEKKGAKGAKDNSAAQEAKAQLAFDLDQIKSAQDAILNSFSNTEKVLEAMHSAGLKDDRDYYGEKIALLTANEGAQVKALNAEKARLQQEVLTGKDKIDNDRKISDVEAKLSKVRKNAATETEVLGIQQASAMKRIESSYLSATQAAQDYLDTTRKQAARELADFGRGPNQREKSAGIAQIEDRYGDMKRDLQNNRAQLELEGKFTEQSKVEYDKRLAIIEDFQKRSLDDWNKHYDALTEKRKDWTNGLSEGLQTYFDEAQNLSKLTSDVVGKSLGGIEDFLVDVTTTGKGSFKSLADSIIKDFARITIKQGLAQVIGGATGASGGGSGGGILGSLLGAGISAFSGSSGLSTGAAVGAANLTGGGLDDLLKFTKNFSGRAIGGPVSAGSIHQVNERGPELLQVAGKQYLMMGNQGGSVTPNGGAQQAQRSQPVINIAVEGQVSRKTRSQIANEVGNELRRAERLR